MMSNHYALLILSTPWSIRTPRHHGQKLAETALLFYRVTDVPFLPNTDQRTKIGIGNRLGKNVPLVIHVHVGM